MTKAKKDEKKQKKSEKKTQTQEISEEEYQALLSNASELKETKEKLLRTVADYENTKKRIERQKEEFVQYANKKILSDFIPIIDNLQRAVDSAKENPNGNSLLEGVEMVHKQLLDVVGEHGLQKIEALGKSFDPNHHEAVGMIESEDHEEDTVVEEVSTGYLYKDFLLKPSMVRVSKKKEKKTEDTDNN